MTTTIQGRRLLSRPEAAAEAGVSTRTLIRLEQEGKLQTVRLRRRVLIEPEELTRMIQDAKRDS